MQLQIDEETWPYINEFFRSVPEALQKVSTVQEALEESEQSGIQRSILRVLQHKFGDLPANIVQTIEATYDTEKLDYWLDQALDSNSLGDFAFPSVTG